MVQAAMHDGPAAMLIRPDGYVAWAADNFGPDDAEGLRTALARWFGTLSYRVERELVCEISSILRT